MSRLARILLCASVLLCLFMVASPPTQAATVTPIGTPAWTIDDIHLTTGAVGTAADNYAEFFALGPQILPEPNHKNYPNVGVGPGAPHDPPYNTEIGTGLTNLGLADKTTLDVSEFSNGKASLLSFMVIANGDVQGTAPDFPAKTGPIIPNASFPITIAGESRVNGDLFSEPGTLEVPTHTSLDPAFANLEGTSHFPVFFFENADFAKDKNRSLNGDYEFRLKLTDTTGAGYDLVVPYAIAGDTGGGGGPSPIPLPAAVWAAMPVLGALPLIKRRWSRAT